jgi:hypothetical protein
LIYFQPAKRPKVKKPRKRSAPKKNVEKSEDSTKKQTNENETEHSKKSEPEVNEPVNEEASSEIVAEPEKEVEQKPLPEKDQPREWFPPKKRKNSANVRKIQMYENGEKIFHSTSVVYCFGGEIKCYELLKICYLHKLKNSFLQCQSHSESNKSSF